MVKAKAGGEVGLSEDFSKLDGSTYQVTDFFKPNSPEEPAMDIPDHRHESRPTRLIALIGLVAVIAAATWLALAVSRSIRQRTVLMAVYPEGSLNAELVKHYQQVLARNGIEVKLDPSAGAVESLADLRDPKSGVTVALVPGGITATQDSPELVSLGTVFYQPLWIFSRDRFPHGPVPLRGRRISIGPEGSSSRVLCLALLGRVGWIDQKSTTLLALAPADSAQAVVRGDIDTAIFVDGWESPVVQQLLKTKVINLESIPRPDALVRKFPYLNRLVLPAGAVAELHCYHNRLGNAVMIISTGPRADWGLSMKWTLWAAES